MASNKRLKLLLAEDDPDDQVLIRDAIDLTGITSNIDIVEDGESLIESLLRKDEDRPDVVLLDLNMPKTDGREALKKIRRHPQIKDIPVFVLTTSTDQKDIIMCSQLGVKAYITKPNSFAELVEVLETISRYWSSIVGFSTGSN